MKQGDHIHILPHIVSELFPNNNFFQHIKQDSFVLRLFQIIVQYIYRTTFWFIRFTVSGQFFIYFADIEWNIRYSVLPSFYVRILKIFQNVQSMQHSFNFFTHKRYYKRILQIELKHKVLFLYSERLKKKKGWIRFIASYISEDAKIANAYGHIWNSMRYARLIQFWERRARWIEQVHEIPTHQKVKEHHNLSNSSQKPEHPICFWALFHSVSSTFLGPKPFLVLTALESSSVLPPLFPNAYREGHFCFFIQLYKLLQIQTNLSLSPINTHFYIVL